MFLCVRSFVIQSVSEESPFFSGVRFLTAFGMTRGGVRNDKLMVNCQWLIVIGKRKVLRVFIFYFSLFVRLCVFTSIRVHLRNLRSDICHSERSEESLSFSGAGFLTVFGMTN